MNQDCYGLKALNVLERVALWPSWWAALFVHGLPSQENLRPIPVQLDPCVRSPAIRAAGELRQEGFAMVKAHRTVQCRKRQRRFL
jgi:hypothetical protein